LEDLRQQFDEHAIEFSKAQRVIHDQTFQLSELQKKEGELARLRSDQDAQRRQLENSRAVKVRQDEELEQECERAKQQRDLYRAELDALKARVQSSQADAERVAAEHQSLLEQLDEALREKEQYKAQIAAGERHRAEQQLAELKRDLAQSFSEWQDIEQEKTLKDSLLQQLEAENAKEKERNALLSMQLNLVDEKMKLADQELSVYRSIDVYHSSMQAELRSYREEKPTGRAPQSSSQPRPAAEASRAAPSKRAAPATANWMAEEYARMSRAQSPAVRGGRKLSLEEMEMDEVRAPPFASPATNSVQGGDDGSETETETATETETNKDEKQRQEAQLQRSQRKAAREKQLREQILEEERRQRLLSRGQQLAQEPVRGQQAGVLRPKRSQSPSVPVKSLMRGQTSQPSQLPSQAQPQDQAHQSKSRSTSSTTQLGSWSMYVPAAYSHVGQARSAPVTSLSQSSSAVLAASKIKMDLDKARRLISM
jgi:hypothetical protein